MGDADIERTLDFVLAGRHAGAVRIRLCVHDRRTMEGVYSVAQTAQMIRSIAMPKSR